MERPADVTKQEVRARALLRRRMMGAKERDRADRAIAAGAARLAALAASGPICAYRPFTTEPGGVHLLAALAGTRSQILLPVTRPDQDLDWVLYVPDDPGDGPLLGPEAIGTAALVLVPALAVDGTGVRLGRGAGCYDRALARVPADVPVVALLYAGEYHAKIPAEPHDRRVTAVLTPQGLQVTDRFPAKD